MQFTAEYILKENGITKAIAFIEDSLQKFKLNSRDLIEAVLISEEAMLMLEEKAPENGFVKVTVKKYIGVPIIKITMPGEALDDEEYIGTISLEQLVDQGENAVRSIMLRGFSDSIKYQNRRNENIITITTGIPEKIMVHNTILAAVLAIITGALLLNCVPMEIYNWISNNIFIPVETLFISALMCLAGPAIFVSITCSLFKYEGFTHLSKSSRMVVINYMITSVIATFMGVLCFKLFKPGIAGMFASEVIGSTSDKFSVVAIISELIPVNIIDPFVTVNPIQLTIIAVVMGLGITMSGKRAKNVKTLFEELDVIFVKIVSIIVKAVPVAAYVSIVNFILASKGAALKSALDFMGTILAGFIIMILIYCLILMCVARLNPITFIKKYLPTMKNSFLKGSSISAIPVNIRACHRKFGVSQKICSFSIPIGATINMDGSCICLMISSLFLARICGVPMDASAIIVLFLLVLALSFGAPIGMGGLILCIVTVLSQLGINVNVVSLIIGINFILEMLMSAVNSLGSVIVTLIVAKREKCIDLEIYNKK